MCEGCLCIGKLYQFTHYMPKVLNVQYHCKTLSFVPRTWTT